MMKGNKIIRLILLITFVLFFNFLGNCQLKKDFPKIKITPSKFKEELSFERFSNTIIILNNVRVNSSDKKYRFLFDTGTNISTLSETLAKECGIEISSTDSIFDGFSYSNIGLGNCQFKLNDISFDNVQVGISKNSKFVGEIDGIIGYNLIKSCIWDLDMFKNQIIITNSLKNIQNKEFAFKQKIKTMNSAPYIFCGVESFYSNLFFDTGDNTMLSLLSTSIGVQKKSKKICGKGTCIRTSNNIFVDTSYTLECRLFPVFHFSKHKRGKFLNNQFLSNIAINIYSETLATENVIGVRILDYYRLIIDFPKQKFYSELIKQDFDLKSFGFGIYPNETEGKYFISTVWNNSEAFNKNIKPNDEVLEINNTALTTQKVSIMYQWIKDEMEKDKISMKIKDREGKIREVYLEKKELIFND